MINDVKIYKHRQGDLMLYFTSQENMERYQKRIVSYMVEEQKFLLARYKIDYMNLDRFLYVALYKKIEEDYFRVEVLDLHTGKVLYRIKHNFCLTFKLFDSKDIS